MRTEINWRFDALVALVARAVARIAPDYLAYTAGAAGQAAGVQWLATYAGNGR
jgi:hypothetical protein